MNMISTDTLDSALEALSAFLAEAKAAPEHLVLIGGAALLAQGFVSRTTRDVDIMAGVDARIGLVDPRPMSDALQSAAVKVARYDLIHLKLFAVVDQGIGRHSRDLEALQPTEEELRAAAQWVLGQDAGEVFPSLVKNTLKAIGHESIAHAI